MKMDPFALSAAFAIDPAYSGAACLPDKSGLSLWSDKKSSPFWLYAPGSLEAWLFDRTRREALSTCMNIYHPGRYRTYPPILYARAKCNLATVPASVLGRLSYSGSIHLLINNRLVVHANGAVAPQHVIVDLAPCLVSQENTICVRIASDGCPPAMLLDGPCFQTGPDWEVSEDNVQWGPPRCFPFEGDLRFPHQEELPEHHVALRVDKDGVYDAGVEVLARVTIRASGAGSIAIHPGESVAEAVDPAEDIREQIVPVVAVTGVGEYTTETKLAFRYLRLAHDPGIRIESMHAAVSMYPARYQGAFACSDQRLTAIWMHAAYTLRACMQLTFLDGLKRDRLPWCGDLYACNFGNYHSFAERPVSEYTLAALMSPDPEESDVNGTITYSLFWVLAARDHALHFGDSFLLRGLLPHCDKQMAAVRRKLDAQGLLPTERFGWLYIDWADVRTEGHSSFLNFLHVMALDAAADLHHAVGDRSSAAVYAQQAADLKSICRRVFWDAARKVFVDNVKAGDTNAHFGRQSNAFAILSGVCTAEQQTDVLRNVLMNTSVAPVGTPYMKFFEARALAACGEAQAMTAMIGDYWGRMLDAGASTFWEALDASLEGDPQYAFYGRPFGKSLCHAWSSGPLQLLSGELFGLRPLKCGWEEFAFRPAPSGLAWACAEIPTPQGPIKVQVSGQRASLNFPEGTRLVWGCVEEERYEGPGELEFEWVSDNENDCPAWRCSGNAKTALGS